MIIRNIEMEDVLQINAIRNYYISTTNYIFRRSTKTYESDLEFFEMQKKDALPSITCVEGGEVLGFAYLSPLRGLDGYDRTMELSIYVKEGVHKKGIGNMLMQKIEDLSKDKYHTIVSLITSDNFGSIEFHKKNGYIITGELKESGYVNGKYLDVTFMQKILD